MSRSRASPPWCDRITSRRPSEGATRAAAHAQAAQLFLNQGDGTFVDDSTPANVTMGRWAWGSAWVDINNDSREDLVVANGFLTRADPGDL